MKLSYWILFIALVLSTIAAYYSIQGLVTIFSTAAIPIIVMASAMEVSKVSVTVWLHKYWTQCRWPMRMYLVPAVGILMLITSMGVFGLLSRAHSDQGAVNGDIAAKVAILDEKIRTEKENIESARQALIQMNAGVDQTLARSTSEGGASRATQLRKNQAKERQTYQTDITKAQERIAQLNEERAPIASQLRKAEAEVGPIKYVAAMIYGDHPDATMLERSVRWVIVLLVIVFDPLAIVMVLAAQESIRWERDIKERRLALEADVVQSDLEMFDELDDRVEDFEERMDNIIETLEDDIEILSKLQPRTVVHVHEENEPALEVGPGMEFDLIESVEDSEPEIEMPVPDEEPVPVVIPDLNLKSANDPTIVDDDDDELLDGRRPERVWKALNPTATLKEHRRLLAHGMIATLPWDDADFVAKVEEGEFDHLFEND